MEGVLGEAKKEGKADEVRARLEEFKKQSQLKAFSVIGAAFGVFTYFKIQFDSDPTNLMN